MTIKQGGNINYLLLYSADSDHGGHEASVRSFIHLESAQAAMTKAYKKLAESLRIPVGPNMCRDPYTVKTENSIRLERYGDHYQWEIIQAVPEDGADSSSMNPDSQTFGLNRYTVTIEEHIAQEFSVTARDIFFAVREAEEEYKRGGFIVQPSTPNTRLIMARSVETGETTGWKEF